MEKADVLRRISTALARDDRAAAAKIAQTEYPFEPRAAIVRRYNQLAATRLFVRDGFVDRYSGHRLVFPGALLLLSRLLPDEFPAHPNWKMSESHFAYWELWPTIDHLIPVTRGGVDAESNWVTTSMLRNAAKGHWTLDELNWTLVPAGDISEWDGLTGWFLDSIAEDSASLTVPAIAKWHRSASSALGGRG